MGKNKERDDFGNRMKGYEKEETNRKLDITQPVYIRLDGHRFSKFTRGLKKPYDRIIMDSMIETAKYILEQTDAIIAYTQSDEISLLYTEPNIPFSGKIQKINSIIPALTAVKFMSLIISYELKDRLPHFDSRTINLPSKEEATNMILWRCMDAKKNAIQATAQQYFSHKKLHQKSQKDMLQMLADIDIDWNDPIQYPDKFKYGTFIQKRPIKKILTEQEFNEIPEQHRPESKEVIRHQPQIINMPAFNTVKNRIEIIFNNQEPVVIS